MSSHGDSEKARAACNPGRDGGKAAVRHTGSLVLGRLRPEAATNLDAEDNELRRPPLPGQRPALQHGRWMRGPAPGGKGRWRLQHPIALQLQAQTQQGDSAGCGPIRGTCAAALGLRRAHPGRASAPVCGRPSPCPPPLARALPRHRSRLGLGGKLVTARRRVEDVQILPDHTLRHQQAEGVSGGDSTHGLGRFADPSSGRVAAQQSAASGFVGKIFHIVVPLQSAPDLRWPAAVSGAALPC